MLIFNLIIFFSCERAPHDPPTHTHKHPKRLKLWFVHTLASLFSDILLFLWFLLQIVSLYNVLRKTAQTKTLPNQIYRAQSAHMFYQVFFFNTPYLDLNVYMLLLQIFQVTLIYIHLSNAYKHFNMKHKENLINAVFVLNFFTYLPESHI